MNRLTYVASGTSYMRLLHEECRANGPLNAWLNEALLSMQKNPEHNFGLLYNAWVEPHFGEVLKDGYRKSLALIQADSGGLQIVTQGKTITEEIKQKVYANQGTHSDMAMSFDEIPLSFSGEKSSRLDLSNRWFDEEKFEHCAKETGRNIFEQIKSFQKMGSDSKPIFIIQGNCFETYMRWTELALSQIPKELHSAIGGCAMGAAALGHGTLEDIQRAFIFTELPLENKSHMHLLAVGSVARLIPNMIFLQNGVYENLHLTYDSTTHTSGLHMGRIYHGRGSLEFPKYLDKVKWPKMFEATNARFPLDMTVEQYHEAINSKTIPYRERYGTRDPVIKAVLATILTSIDFFRDHVNECLASKKVLMKFADSVGNGAPFASLYEVKNKTDFDYWMNNVGRYVGSKPVSTSKRSSLEGFFE